MKHYQIVRINRENYSKFDDMVYWRINKRERIKEEMLEATKPDLSGMHETLTNPNLYVYAALDADKFVGWISIVYIPKVGILDACGHLYVDELWVQPTYRMQGIGEALMEKADELLHEIKVEGIRLYVNTANENARKLYKKCGYIVNCYLCQGQFEKVLSTQKVISVLYRSHLF